MVRTILDDKGQLGELLSETVLVHSWEWTLRQFDDKGMSLYLCQRYRHISTASADINNSAAVKSLSREFISQLRELTIHYLRLSSRNRQFTILCLMVTYSVIR
jgi:hypothetical protein